VAALRGATVAPTNHLDPATLESVEAALRA
jgi:hypothetical protein